MNKYMHMIDGEPAFFDGNMICYAKNGLRLDKLLCDSLEQIRSEQQASIAYRKKRGCPFMHYGYLRVRDDK